MRTKNSIKNVMVALIGQLVNVLSAFVCRTVFIYVLGAEYLGVNGLFSNILSMLSLAELGVGSAIIYNMYGVLAVRDEEKLKSLTAFYAKAYKVIALVVALCGIGLMPFLGTIIGDTPNIANIKSIYLLFLLNSVISYFFSYKASILMADQKNYIVVIRQQAFKIIQTVIQIFILFASKSYILYLVVQIVCGLASNIIISIKANSIYPYLKEKDIKPLDLNEKKNIYKYVRAAMYHKIGDVVVNSTDNILISHYVGVFWVGLYSNYILILQMLNAFISQVFKAITGSVGNLNALESKEKSYEVYNKIFFLNFWIYGFCSVCLWNLFNPFIMMWLGTRYLLDARIVLLIVINFFIAGMRQCNLTYSDTLGLFWNDRYKPLFESIINLVVSIILLQKIGMVGVLLGTLISTLTTSFWIEPFVLFKYGFEKKTWVYFRLYSKYVIVTLSAGVLTAFACYHISGYSLSAFLLRLLISVFLTNIVFYAYTRNMVEYKSYIELFKGSIKERF
ncbi:MAG: lipopolysaccharide biosynthesis protein [Solirubrobacterales bacterium]